MKPTWRRHRRGEMPPPLMPRLADAATHDAPNVATANVVTALIGATVRPRHVGTSFPMIRSVDHGWQRARRSLRRAMLSPRKRFQPATPPPRNATKD
jgi:hypothetical protein